MTNLSGQSFGRYNLLEHLGEGGMATVYKAFDTRLETHVAVKVIRTETLAPTVLERALKRFEREAKALARLTHPNIVKVTDYGEHDGKPYLVMTYLPGGTLKQRLGKPIPWQEAARTLLPIVRALDYAHRQNMIHRDVKPANILFTADGEPMLTDFGIAKVLNLEETTDLTGTGMGIGTPEYMAPEQWTGETTHQSDQYSLGVVFYEMLTGRKPYTAETPAKILLKQATEPLPRPSQFIHNLPDKVEKILLKAMAKNPADRYPGMGAFASVLENAVISNQSSMISKKEEAKRTPKREPTKAVAKTVAAPVVKKKTERVTPPVPFGSAKKQVTSVLRYWPVAVVIVAILILALVLNPPDSKPEQPAPTETQPVAPMVVELPTFTRLAPTAVELPPITDTPAIVSIPEQVISHGVDMRLVPAGTFKMGSDSGNPDEKPIHDVYLDSYYMDVYEVTNKLYKVCVTAGVCDPPTSTGHYNNSNYNNHPVVYVNWNMAKAYCEEWRGGYLPTEAQWEKAARGTDGRTYPWGEGISCGKTNYSLCLEKTTPVGSYPNGISPYGLYDMAGNVWEWVADWYSETYYGLSPLTNPLGPSSGTDRVQRGGSFWRNEFQSRSTDRGWGASTDSTEALGFRCARPANSSTSTTATSPPAATAVSPQASLPEVIFDSQGVIMRLVPAGMFKMGSESGEADEKPVHDVVLDAYYMDVYEVTNKLYKVCVVASVCDPLTYTDRYNNSKYENHPVVYVDRDMAKTYCEWRGGDLPTEAQWEKAARGDDERTYPWGEGLSCDKANYASCGGGTKPVGSYPDGISPYGLYDMAGNVLEWVIDWYKDTYYQDSPLENPLGPNTGQVRVLRGGSWYLSDSYVRSTFRFRGSPILIDRYFGFRCARPAP